MHGDDIWSYINYHKNLTHLHKYNDAGPGSYELPQLFDNYKKNNFNIAGLKKNAQFEFGLRYPKEVLITKQHLVENIGLVSPGPARYNSIPENTFDKHRITEMSRSPFEQKLAKKYTGVTGNYNIIGSPSRNPKNVGFTTTTRFHVPSTMREINKDM